MPTRMIVELNGIKGGSNAHTRLNFPLLIALHRFFVPLWVFSFGKLAMADVENSLAVATKREKNMTDNVEDNDELLIN